MLFSVQVVVLATLALDGAFAQPAHRHNHKHRRELDDVLGKREPQVPAAGSSFWNNPDNYKDPATGLPLTDAQRACVFAGNDVSKCPAGGSSSGSSANTPVKVENKQAVSPSQASQSASAAASSAAPAASSSAPSSSSGSQSDSGPGAHIYNKASTSQTFIFYKNDANDYGQATSPGQSVTIAGNSDQFVSLDTAWKGHIQRGTSTPTVTTPATWVEFQVKAGDGAAWGDISLQKGCDGGAKVISATDPSQSFGFTRDCVTGVPEAALRSKPDGSKALDYTTGGWAGTTLVQPNQAAIDWANQNIGQSQAYILGGSGTLVAKSSNNIIHVEFY